MAEISDIDFWKKAQNRRFLGSSTAKNFFWQSLDKKTPTHQKFWLGPSPSTFCGVYSKKRFWDFYFSDFFSDFPRKPLKSRFFVENEQNLVVISREKIWKKMKISKTFFRFLSKVCPKKFSWSGTPKIDDFGSFFKNRCPKFLPSGKKGVFWDLAFFEKLRKWGVVFGGAPQNCFLQKLTNVARLVCKN